MASYAPNFTDRLKLSYSTLGANYTQTWRTRAGFVPFDLIDGALPAFYAAIAPLFNSDFQIDAAEQSTAGSDFFLPLSLGDLAAVAGTSTGTIANQTEFRCCALQFVGKTTTGNPWRVSVFGALVAPFNTGTLSLSDDFRINAPDSVAVADALAALEQASNAGLGGNDGNSVLFRPYANIIISRYRINRIRRFG